MKLIRANMTNSFNLTQRQLQMDMRMNLWLKFLMTYSEDVISLW